MAYTAPVTHTAGDLITASDWNTYIRDNLNSLSGLIAYVNGAALSGWSEFTTARGLFILGLVSGGTLATAVGTPLTNQQNISHSHTVSPNGWTGDAGGDANRVLHSNGAASPSGSEQTTSAPSTGTAAAGSIGIPYIQLLCIQKD